MLALNSNVAGKVPPERSHSGASHLWTEGWEGSGLPVQGRELRERREWKDLRQEKQGNQKCSSTFLGMFFLY